MLATNAEVMLYKDPQGNGFNLRCKEFTCVEENMSFVRLTDVTFDIYEDKPRPGAEACVHAVAKGKLSNVYPQDCEPSLGLKKACLKLKVRQVDYKPGHESFFFTVDDSKEVYSAKELYAFDGKIYVLE